MNLQNLVTIGLLVEHETDKTQVGKLLEAATRCIDDSRNESISKETRLDAAYKATMQCAMLALWASGLGPRKTGPVITKQ